MATVLNEWAILGTYRPAAPLFVGGRGCRLYDDAGRGYLDFASGIGVNAFGYGNSATAAAIGRALDAGIVHASNLFRTAPAMELAAELVDRSFAHRVFFCNSGAEANEAAFKFARRWARERGGELKHEIIALRGSFHGRLFGALAATDRPSMREPFEPVMPGVRFIDVGDLDAAAAAISSERTAAVIAEPVQGEGGVRPLPAGFLGGLRELADAAGALLILDEVQCGLGRTGQLFAHEATGIVPDMLTLAKPLAGGLPMGATLVNEAVAASIRPGDHATTFGGGPLVATVALDVVRRIADPIFLAGVVERGRHLAGRLDGLRRLSAVVDSRGAGLMWGVELSTAAGPVVTSALEAGLLATTAGDRVVRLLPPLVIGFDEIDEGVAILEQVLS